MLFDVYSYIFTYWMHIKFISDALFVNIQVIVSPIVCNDNTFISDYSVVISHKFYL